MENAPALPQLNLDLPPEPSGSLREATQRLGLTIAEDQLTQIDAYCRSLWSWNEKVNLTRHTDYDTFVRRDLLDSYVLAQQLQPEEEILDIGTGGGVPGLVVAILRPDVTVSVCDSVAKKSKVVQDIVNEAEIDATVYDRRAQDIMDDLRFHSAVSRAAGSIRQLLNWMSDCWMNVDRLLAIKGPRWVDERGDARHRGLMNQIDLRKLISYPMPGTQSESVIVEMKHSR